MSLDAEMNEDIFEEQEAAENAGDEAQALSAMQNRPNGEVLVSLGLLRSFTSTKLQSMQNDVAALINSQQTLLSQVATMAKDVAIFRDTLKELVSHQKSSHSQAVAKPRRKGIPKMPILDFAKGASSQHASRPLLKYAILGIVISFVHAMPCLRFWVSDDMWNNMRQFSNYLDGTQGFAALFFSKRNNDRSVANTPPGRLWMFIMTGALQTVVSSARRHFRRAAAPVEGYGSASTVTAVAPRTADGVHVPESDRRAMEPEWLARFQGDGDIVRAVNESMKKFAGGGSEMSVSSGTGRPQEGSQGGSQGASPGSGTRRGSKKRSAPDQVDTVVDLRREIVTRIRSSWLDTISTCRQQLRKHLYMKLTCVLDKVVRNKTISAARDKGYAVILNGYESDMEEIDAEQPNLEHTIWAVKDTYTDALAAKDQRNVLLRKALERQFPSLHCKLTYKRTVRVVGDSSPDSEGNGSCRRESKTEHVPLHEVANGMLMEAFAAESMQAALASSPLSLKAVHVLAIALRGLIMTVLNSCRDRQIEISVAEKAAFGDHVTLNEDSIHKVKVMLDKTAANGRLSDFYSKCYAAKFQTTDVELAQETRRAQSREINEEEAVEAAPSSSAAMSLLGDWTEK